MKITASKDDLIFTTVNYIILFMFFLVVAIPLIYVLSASFSSPESIIKGEVWLFPIGFNLEGYKAVFRNDMIVTGYLNSLFYMIVGTTINIVLTIMAAYPLSRKDFHGRGIIMFLFVFTMIFSGGLIPNYLLVRDLGILNSRWALLLPNAMAVWNVIMTRTYFQSNIPIELLEASRIDGCSNFKFIMQVVLPLSRPIIAVMVLFYAVGHWNAFFGALIYLDDAKLFPLQLVLRNILIENEVTLDMLAADGGSAALQENLRELLKFSLIVVASAPLLILYPFVQKYFVKGVMIGSLKG